MNWNEFRQNVKNFKLPYYLSDSPEYTDNLDCEKLPSRLVSPVSWKGFFLHVQKNNSNEDSSLQDELSSMSASPRASAFYIKRRTNKKTFYSHLGKIAEEYFTKDRGRNSNSNVRIKYASLERVSLEELHLYYRFSHSTKRIRKMCDYNLWCIMNALKEMYNLESDESKQTLILDIGRLILHFIFSSISQLRFDHCKNILEKLAKLENIFFGCLTGKQETKSRGSFSQLGASGYFEATAFRKPSTTNSAFGTPFSSKSEIGQSIDMITSKLFNNSILSTTPKVRINIAEGGNQHGHSKRKDLANSRRIITLIARIKYTIVQMGHFLHYDELSNRVTEIFSKTHHHEDPKTPKTGGKASIAKLTPTNAPRSDLTNRVKENLKKCTNFTAAVSNASSIADGVDHSKKERLKDKDFFYLKILASKNLKDYFYFTQTFLDDFETEITEARLEQLKKYCKWKSKKWIVNHKREKFEQKYEQYKIVCKICAQKIHVDKMKDHSGLCRKRAELDKEIKGIDNKISDIVFKAVLRSKELHTKLVLNTKKYSKLSVQSQSQAETNPPTPGFPKSIYNFGQPEIAQSDCTFSTADTPVYAIRKQATENLRSGKTKPQSPNFAVNLKKLEAEDDPRIRKGSFTERLNFESLQTQQDRCENEQQNVKSARTRKMTDESSKSRESENSNLQTPPTKSQKHHHNLLSLHSQGRRFSESRVASAPKNEEINQKPMYKKRNNVFQIDLKALEQVLISINYKEDSQKSKESSNKDFHSVQIRSPESSVTLTESSSSMCSMEQEESEPDSPILKLQKSPVPQYLKSRFFNLNKSNTTNIESSGNKEIVRRSDRCITYQGAQTSKLSEEESKNSSDEGLPVMSPLRAGDRKKSIFFSRPDDASPTLSTEARMDPKIVEKMTKLRHDISQTKIIINLYEIIRDKGKGIINQPSYLKSLEITKTEICEEVNALRVHIEDHDVIEFSDQFLNLLDERVMKGKKFRDTKRDLNKLNGVFEQEQDAKTAFDRRPSLMKNTFISPKSMSQLHKASLRLKDTKNLFKANQGREIQLSASMNPMLYTRSQDPLKADKTIKFMGLRIQGINSEEDDSLGSSQAQTPFSYMGGRTTKAARELNEENMITSLNSVHTTKSVDESISEKEESNSESVNVSVRVDRERREYDQGNLSKVSEELMSPSRWNSENKSPTFFYNNQQTTSIVLDGVGNEDNPNKPSILLPSDPSIILHENLIMGSRELSSSNSNTSMDSSDESSEESSDGDSESFNQDSEGLVISKNDIEYFHSSKKNSPQQSKEPKLKSRDRQKTIDSLASMTQFCATQRVVVTKAIAGDTRTLTGILDLDGQRRLRNRALTSEELRMPERDKNSNKKLLMIPDVVISGKSSKRPSQRESQLPSLKATSNVYMEDFMANNENQEVPESLFLVDTVLERGYHSDSQVKQIRIPVKIQPLIGMNDFEPLKMISRGAFGRVWLVRRKATNDLYAMKVIDLTEKFLKNNKELENLRKENKVFGLAQEDFVVRALFTFTFQTCICFVMEYMIGGDFGDILYNYCALEEDVARFYIAEIVLAVEYLHSLGIVHRDLKPDNILLDKHGHAKLTDFGLSETGLSQKMKAGHIHAETNAYQAKIQEINRLCGNMNNLHINLKLNGKVMEKKYDSTNEGKVDEVVEVKSKDSLPSPRDASPKKKNSKRHPRLIGTPDYMAPEIILGASVTSYSSDWWSLGIILFEFLVGVPPFNDGTPDKIYDNIVNLRIPWDQLSIGYDENCISPEAADLIQKLLTLDHKKRLGTNGVAEIKKHKFFEKINWDNLRRQQPPIIPEHKSETDTTNFVRLAGMISDKEKEDLFAFWPKDEKSTTKLAEVKQYLKGAFESMFNVAALDSDNMKLVEEALKEREAELRAFRDHIIQEADVDAFYDDVFDHPNH